ncbi:Conserved_hypothetical protein [Hexamita inflata]|uniref:Uncharacterized protein n=1 Tax=Hexamita inflata TaxID=28002 RepID=A0ABP1JF89_9EUKA
MEPLALLSSALLQHNSQSALEQLLQHPQSINALKSYFGPNFTEFQNEVDALPLADQLRQFLFALKIETPKLYAKYLNESVSIFKPQSKLDQLQDEISTSIFDGVQTMTESYIERHKVNPRCDKISNNLNSSMISTIVYQQQPMKRSKSQMSLSNVILSSKQNEIERIKLNKQLSQLTKESVVCDKAIMASKNTLQDLFKQIRQVQQLNLRLNNNQVVKQVAASQENTVIPKIQDNIKELQAQLKTVTKALEKVKDLNPDFKLHPFGNTAVEQLDSMYQQLIAITEENVFIASKEEQVLICQEIKNIDGKREALIKKINGIQTELKHMEKERDGLKRLLDRKM